MCFLSAHLSFPPLTSAVRRRAPAWLLLAVLSILPLHGSAGNPDIVAGMQFAALRDAIRELEARGDTWHPGLAESMVSLAAQIQALGGHAEALPLLERAVHVNRVNHGLYTLQQIPALRMQIESHVALGEWNEADGLHQYMFYLHSRALDDLDPELIPALEDYARWNMRAFGQRMGLYPALRLVDAYQLYSVALTIVDQDPDLIEQSRERMLQRLAYIAWLMSRTGVMTRPEAQYADVRRVDDAWVDRVTGRRYRRSNNAFLQGEYALEQIVEMRHQRLQQADHSIGDEQRNVLLAAHADAMLDLADWYLLFNRRNASDDAYTRAWQAMADEDESLRSAIFERIVLLPTFETEDPPPGPETGDQPPEPSTRNVGPAVQIDETVPYVIMRFDLNRYGRAVDVNIIESWPADDTAMQRRLISSLRDSRLRPVIRDGEAIQVEDLVYRFPYITEQFGTGTGNVESAGVGTQ